MGQWLRWMALSPDRHTERHRRTDAAGHVGGSPLSRESEPVLLRAARPSIDRSRRERACVKPRSGCPHHSWRTSSGSQSGKRGCRVSGGLKPSQPRRSGVGLTGYGAHGLLRAGFPRHYRRGLPGHPKWHLKPRLSGRGIQRDQRTLLHEERIRASYKLASGLKNRPKYEMAEVFRNRFRRYWISGGGGGAAGTF